MADTAVAPIKSVAIALDPQGLLSQAVDKGASIETLERLVSLAKDMKAVQAKEAWHQAMAEFQRRCPAIVKSKTAQIATAKGSYSYRYAPLDEIMDTARPLLGELGLSVYWSSRIDANGVAVNCRISHVLGHSEDSGEVRMPVSGAEERGGGNPAQRVGSALTYARRYSFLSVSGLTPEDDDDAQGTERPRPAGPDGQEGAQGGPGPIVFPFGKHKGEEPSALELADLHRELAFWTKKSEEEDNPQYRATNERLVKAIQEAIAEKTARPVTVPTGAPQEAQAPRSGKKSKKATSDTGSQEDTAPAPEASTPPAGAPTGPTVLDQMDEREKLWVRVRELAEAKGPTFSLRAAVNVWRDQHWPGTKLGELSILQIQAFIAHLATIPDANRRQDELPG